MPRVAIVDLSAYRHPWMRWERFAAHYHCSIDKYQGWDDFDHAGTSDLAAIIVHFADYIDNPPLSCVLALIEGCEGCQSALTTRRARYRERGARARAIVAFSGGISWEDALRKWPEQDPVCEALRKYWQPLGSRDATFTYCPTLKSLRSWFGSLAGDADYPYELLLALLDGDLSRAEPALDELARSNLLSLDAIEEYRKLEVAGLDRLTPVQLILLRESLLGGGQ